MSKMSEDEEAVYMKAFSGSKAKTVKERMAEGDAAVKKYREGGVARAVEKGVKEGTIAARVKARKRKVDEASGF